MSNLINNPIVIAFIATIIALLGIIYVYPILSSFLRKKKMDSDVFFNSAKELTKIAELLLTLLTTVTGTKGIFDTILAAGRLAVDAVEQMYKSGKVAKEERFNQALNIAKMGLEQAGVEVTEEMIELIETTIEAAVFALPKTHKN